MTNVKGRKIQAQKIRFLGRVTGCLQRNMITNETIREELQIFNVNTILKLLIPLIPRWRTPTSLRHLVLFCASCSTSLHDLPFPCTSCSNVLRHVVLRVGCRRVRIFDVLTRILFFMLKVTNAKTVWLHPFKFRR